MRWVALLLVVGVNDAAIALAVAPGLVTFAEVLPQGVVCASCMSADIQMALAKAAASGRAQIVQLLHRFMPYLVLLGAMNIGLVAVLTLRRRVA